MTPATGPVRVLELRSVRGTGGGPEKTILLSAAQHRPSAAAVTVCYIRDDRDDRFHIDQTARALGVRYVEIRERHSFDWRIWRSLTDLIDRDGIQIIHAHDYKTDLLAYLLAKRTRTVAMATAHGWSGDSRKERAYYRMDKTLLARLPLVIAVSEPIRRTLIAHGASPDRVRRIRNGIDHTAFRRVPGLREKARLALAIPDNACVVGSVGRLESEKGYDALVKAVARVQPPLTPWLAIIGEGSQRQELERLARETGLEARFRLPGHRSDALDMHHAFDVYAQSSLTEGIPNAVLEAMAVGTPVVATDVGGTSELITDGVHGRLVGAQDSAALARGLTEALRDRHAMQRWAQAARQRIEDELSFAHRLALIEDIYTQLAAGSGARRQSDS